MSSAPKPCLYSFWPIFFGQDMHRPDIDGQHIQILVQLGLQKRPAVAKACIVDKQIHPAILQRLGQPQTLALFWTDPLS